MLLVRWPPKVLVVPGTETPPLNVEEDAPRLLVLPDLPLSLSLPPRPPWPPLGPSTRPTSPPYPASSSRRARLGLRDPGRLSRGRLRVGWPSAASPSPRTWATASGPPRSVAVLPVSRDRTASSWALLRLLRRIRAVLGHGSGVAQ